MGWKKSNEGLKVGAIVEAVQHAPEAGEKGFPCPLPHRARVYPPGSEVNGRPIVAVCVKANCNTGFLGVEERGKLGKKRFRVTEAVRFVQGI